LINIQEIKIIRQIFKMSKLNEKKTAVAKRGKYEYLQLGNNFLYSHTTHQSEAASQMAAETTTVHPPTHREEITQPRNQKIGIIFVCA
jgi:hypothetical protein